jgi:hypothetical protein
MSLPHLVPSFTQLLRTILALISLAFVVLLLSLLTLVNLSQDTTQGWVTLHTLPMENTLRFMHTWLL